MNYSVSKLLLGFLVISGCISHENSGMFPQNPSPMSESIRSHDRVSAEECKGERYSRELDGKMVQLYIPETACADTGTDLIIHFHGSQEVTEYAVCNSSRIMLTVNGASGSSTYENLFSSGDRFTALLDFAYQETGAEVFRSITLSGWSAGYGAVRALLSRYPDLIDGVILLDGLHTSYIPEHRTLYQGGKLDSSGIAPFLHFAQQAIQGKKSMLITHSEVFPGTYASTTECTDYLVRSLGLQRKPVLCYGAVGMQQVGEVSSGNLLILSYAGNSAPDHVDHLHALNYFLKKLKL